MKVLKVGLLAAVLAGTWGGMYFIAEENATAGAAFEAALAEELNIPVGSFNQNKVRGVTALDLSGYQLTDLTGLEHFQSLETLDLSGNRLTDVSELANLPHLKVVDLSFNRLTDVPELPDTLETLNLEGNDVSDLSFLPASETLTTLNMRDNDVTSLEALEQTPNVTHLNVRGNAIESIGPLQGLTGLVNVNLRDNRIADFSPLENLDISERLYVTGNATHDYSSLDGIAEQVADRDFERLPDRPTFSVDSGIIAPGTTLSLEATDGADIFYTTDGSDPTPESTRYMSPITLDPSLTADVPVLSNNRTATNRTPPTFERGAAERALVIRAISVKDGATSALSTRTYLLDADLFTSNLPVVSLTTDARNLFDEKIGIYTPGDVPDGPLEIGRGNFFETGREWERPAHLDYFEGGEHVFGQDIGIRIHGGFSRGLAQKSLRLYARSEYGQSRFYHPFFPGNDETEFNRLLLRNAGNDWQGAMLRDAFMQELLADRPLDFQDYQPTIVLVNGEYWGLHNLRELYSPDYFEIKYDIDETELAILEADQDMPDGFVIETGQDADLIHYREMVRFAETNDLNESDKFTELERQMDVDNFLEYVAYQAFYGNLDSMFNNYIVWRKATELTDDDVYGHDGRWRWVVFDLDQGFAGRLPLEESINYDMFAYLTGPGPEHALFRSLMASTEGRERFVEIFNELLAGPFTPEAMTSKLDEVASTVAPEMPRQIARWGNIPSVDAWEAELAEMRQFAERRPAVIREQLQARFGTE
ncbi:CotH kinase family protein [Exiguobacterium sp. AB2]|uniref:CotH kinase family protein n=1 Tax=Exiguobacterium sp. AB2 TaxID=1484479 RepID=UPI0004A947B4|nr:CotH kinase family protein [Exiguobacterium sp. AB2]KDN58849.1 hypothetical protein DI14_10690 [Exiguobacterium sp. AB2]